MAMSHYLWRKAGRVAGIGMGTTGCGSVKAWRVGQQRGIEGISFSRGA
jgi:hypothetical protein